MAADTPLARDGGLADKVQSFIAQAKDKAKDGLTFAELGVLTYSLMRLVILQVDELDVPGALKKADVLAAAGLLFDTLADQCVPGLAKPFWWIAKPAIRSIVIALLSGVMEKMLPDVRAAA